MELSEMCTTTAGMMGVEPINLAGKEMPSKKYENQSKHRQKKAQLNYKYQKVHSKKGIVQ